MSILMQFRPRGLKVTNLKFKIFNKLTNLLSYTGHILKSEAQFALLISSRNYTYDSFHRQTRNFILNER